MYIEMILTGHWTFLLIGVAVLPIECRVYCSDANATPWNRAGKSCPLRCDNVLAAIDKLKYMDHLDEKLHWIIENEMIENQTIQDSNEIGSDESTEEQPLNLVRFKRLLLDENHNFNPHHSSKTRSPNQTLASIIRNEMRYLAITEKVKKSGNCLEYVKHGIPWRTAEELLKKCIDKQPYLKNFASRIERLLYKHLKDYKLSKVIYAKLMTKIRKWKSQSSKVRALPKLVRTLRSFLRDEKRKEPATITLTSRQCLTVYMPGCFCKKGYVERGPECITPKQCLDLKADKITSEHYLSRVIID